MKRLIGEVEKIPFGYGVAWRDFAYCGSVCYPVPLNILMRWLRNAWFSLSRLPYMRRQSWWEQREIEIFHRAQERANARALKLAESIAEKIYAERFERDYRKQLHQDAREMNAAWVACGHKGTSPFWEGRDG